MANIIEYHDYKSLYFSIRNTFKVFFKEKIEETDFIKLGNKFHKFKKLYIGLCLNLIKPTFGNLN